MTYPGTSVYPSTSGIYPSLGGSAGIASYADDSLQWPVKTLRIDWTRSGFTSPYATLDDLVEEVTVERSITSDLPADVGLIDGYASAQLSATVSGAFADGTNVADLLAPYRGDSPLFGKTLIGCPITCDMGLLADTGPVVVRQFTGVVRTLRVDSATKTVTITALDNADTLRASVTLPAFAQPRGAVFAHGYKFDVNSQAVIDYVLRRNGIYASPPAIATAQLSITGHGWLVAEVGRSTFPTGTATAITADSWWTAGPFNMLAVRNVWDANHTVTVECYTPDQYTLSAGTGVGIAVWVHAGNDMADVIAGTSRYLVELRPTINPTTFFGLKVVVPSSGAPSIVATMNDGSSEFAAASRTLTTTTGWTYVGVHYQLGTGGTTTVSLRMAGVTTVGSTNNPTNLPFLRDQMQVIAHTDCRDWSNLQVWYDYQPPTTWPGETWTPQATIGIGFNRLSHLPDVVNADSWQVIRDVTAAEYAICGFDESGIFNFQQRTNSHDTNTVIKAITADRALLDIALETSSDSTRNIITTQVTAAYLSPAAVVKTQDVTDYETPVGVTTYRVALPANTFGPFDIQPITQYSTVAGTWVDTLLEGYVAVQSTNPSAELPTSSPTFVWFEHVTDAYALTRVPDPTLAITGATPTGNRVGLLKVLNQTATPIRFATASGSAALRILGWALVNDPTVNEVVTNANSVAVLGQRVFAIPTSPYRQLVAPLRPIATQLLTQLANPLPVIDSVSCLGDPAVTLGATVRMVDQFGQGSFKATVTKVTRTVNNQGLIDTYAVRPVAPPGLGITDDNELGIADSTLVAGP